jgi:hypothetical protein
MRAGVAGADGAGSGATGSGATGSGEDGPNDDAPHGRPAWDAHAARERVRAETDAATVEMQ